MQDSQRNKTTEEAIREIANRLYLSRHSTGDLNDSEMYLVEARRIFKNPVRRQLFHLKGQFTWLEKRKIEPLADWLDQADIFRIIEKLSPIVEAAGVLFIPVVLFMAAQNYDKEQTRRQESLEASQAKLQQSIQDRQEDQAKEQREQDVALEQRREVTDYWNQVLTILTDVDGDLRSPQNAQIRSFISAITFDLLRDDALEGNRKGDVVRVLYQAGLVQLGEDKKSNISIIDLSNTELQNIDLSEVDFKEANFRKVNFSGTDFTRADMQNTDLSAANLSGVKLLHSNLNGADLSAADLSGADLNNAQLKGVNLRDATLSGADFTGADLQNVKLSAVQLDNALFCNTVLDTALRDLVAMSMEGRLVVDPDLTIDSESIYREHRDCGKNSA